MSFFQRNLATLPAFPPGLPVRRKPGRPSWSLAIAALAVFLLAAVTGIIIALGSNQLTIVFAGLLLIIPVVCMVKAKDLLPILFVYMFLIQGPAVEFLHLRFAIWMGSGLAFLFLCRTLLELLMAKTKRNAQIAPWSGSANIVVAAIIYLGFFFFGLLLGSGSMVQNLSAIRFGLPMFGVLMVLSSVQFAEQRIRLLWRLIVLIAMLQLPFVIYQHFFGMGAIGWDAVVGTFGPGMSAVLVLFSLTALVYSLACWSRGLMPTWLFAIIFLIGMANILLGEVKAIAFWLPLGLILIMRRKFFRNIGAFVAYSCFIAIFMVGTFAAYKAMYWGEKGTAGNTVEEKLQHTGGYFFDPYEIRYNSGELGRVASLYLWYRDPSPDLLNRLIGYGPGASAISVATGRGVVASRYRPLNVNSTALSTLLWDVGILGALVFIAMLLFSIFSGWRFVSRGRAPPTQLAIVDTSAVVLVLLLTTLIYNRTIIDETSTQLLFLFCAGCIVQFCRFGSAGIAEPFSAQEPASGKNDDKNSDSNKYKPRN